MSSRRTCSKCAAEMQDGQDWCLRCGQGASHSASTGPGWRSAAVAIGASVVLSCGAAAAAYAALKTAPPASPNVVAQTPPATQTPPAGSTAPAEGGTPPAEGSAPPSGGTQPGGSSQPPTQTLGETPVQPPKIPGKAATPAAGEEGLPFEAGGEGEGGLPFGQAGEQGIGHGKHSGNGKGGNGGREHGSKGAGKGKGAAEEGGSGAAEGEGEGEGLSERPEGSEAEHGKAPKHMVPTKKVPILLDTNAAHIYNPDHYPHELLGDPSLAIDGEVTTAWTVKPRTEPQPHVDVGISINMHVPERIAEVVLITATPRMKVQIYGTTRLHHLPGKLKGKRWVKLSGVHVLAKRKSAIYLRHHRRTFRQLLIWIVGQPSAGAGKTAAGSATGNGATTTSTTTSTTITTSTTSPLAGLGSSTSTTSAIDATGASSPLTTTTSTGSIAASSTTTTSTTTSAPEPGRKVGISEIECYEPKSG